MNFLQNHLYLQTKNKGMPRELCFWAIAHCDTRGIAESGATMNGVDEVVLGSPF